MLVPVGDLLELRGVGKKDAGQARRDFVQWLVKLRKAADAASDEAGSTSRYVSGKRTQALQKMIRDVCSGRRPFPAPGKVRVRSLGKPRRDRAKGPFGHLYRESAGVKAIPIDKAEVAEIRKGLKAAGVNALVKMGRGSIRGRARIDLPEVNPWNPKNKGRDISQEETKRVAMKAAKWLDDHGYFYPRMPDKIAQVARGTYSGAYSDFFEVMRRPGRTEDRFPHLISVVEGFGPDFTIAMGVHGVGTSPSASTSPERSRYNVQHGLEGTRYPRRKRKKRRAGSGSGSAR